MKTKTITTILLTLFLASMLSMAFNVVSVAAISDSWQIGDFEPLGGWPGVVDEFAVDWRTGDIYEFQIDDPWSNFPGVIGVGDEVNIYFDITTTAWYQFVFVRAGGETNTIEVDGISRWYVFAIIEGADYDPAPLFETYINLHLASGPHIITIYQDPETKPEYADGFFAIDALALIPMPDWDDPHFDLNLQLGPGGYDTSGVFPKINVKVPEYGSFHIKFYYGYHLSWNSIADLDATDGEATVYIPSNIYVVWAQARGKPGLLSLSSGEPGRADTLWQPHTWVRDQGKPTWEGSYSTIFLTSGTAVWTSPDFTNNGLHLLSMRWYPTIEYPYDWVALSLYNWYDGKAAPYDPNAYHPMTPEWYVGIMAFKASPGSLRVDIALTQGKPTTTYQVLLWHDYRMTGQGYWIIGTLTTDGDGRGSATISYSLTAGTYILGIDLMWDDGISHQQILSAGSGVLGLQNSITIPS